MESASKAEKEKGNEKNPDTPSSTPPKPPQPPVLCEADMRKTGWQMTTQYFGTPGQQLHAMLMTATANASM